MKRYDICIIGGGAAGMAAAIAAQEQYLKNLKVQGSKESGGNDSAGRGILRIALLEKKEALGKKLAATGNGRCNITNESADDYESAKEFLEGIGIILRTEDEGRVYPYSGRASHIVSALEERVMALGVDVMTGIAVSKVAKEDSWFVVSTDKSELLKARRLIIACGGKSAPQYGTSGDGYAWAKNFGHSVTRLAPALAPIELAGFGADGDGAIAKGARAKAKVTLINNAKGREIVASETGEVQFTESGISGIAVFNLSRYVRVEDGETIKDLLGKYDVSIDFMPEYEEYEVYNLLKKRSLSFMRGTTAGIPGSKKPEKVTKQVKKATSAEILHTIVDEKLAEIIAEQCDMADISAAAKCLKDYRCIVSGVGGWKTAQVTAGGVILDEIDRETMESKLVDGLYFAGEILDYDGPCGGFNLNNAWLTGVKAGRAAAEKQGK